MMPVETFFAERMPDERFEGWKSDFDVAELRSMSTSSLVLRSLARAIKIRESRPALREGVYVIVDEGGPFPRAFAQISANPSLDPITYLRSIPAKYAVGSAPSMSAAQVAIEAGATGPLHCISPGPDALDFLLTQARLDLGAGTVQGCWVGFAGGRTGAFGAALAYVTDLDSSWPERLRGEFSALARKAGERIE